MEAINFTQKPEGATHFLRYASGHVVWCCVTEGGPNGQPTVSEWDSFNNYWVPCIHNMGHYEAIGLIEIVEAVEPPAKSVLVLIGESPKGATHHYEHGGDVNWYRETNRGLYRWEQGSWCASRHKDIKDLMDNCPLGQLTLLGVEQDEGNLTDVVTDGRECVVRDAAQPEPVSADTADELARNLVVLLRSDAWCFDSHVIADLHDACDAELTKRDAAVCGGQKYLDAHWFERGALPPVGTVCEAATEGCKYEKCEILAFHKGQVALRWFEFNGGCLDVLELDGWTFRPLRNERDELIEVLKGTHAASLTNLDMLASAILADGFKRDGGAA